MKLKSILLTIFSIGILLCVSVMGIQHAASFPIAEQKETKAALEGDILLDQPTPDRDQPAQALEQAAIVEKMLGYIEGEQADDPLVEVEDGIFVKSSNVHGILIDGTRYYYSLFPHMSFDPVVAAKIGEEQVTIFYQDDDPAFPVIIYTVD
jgi:DNA/RNA endonuclease YhcR with UshA esterase domain